MIIRKDIEVNQNPTPEQIRMLEQAVELQNDDDELHGPFDSVEELMESLNSGD